MANLPEKNVVLVDKITNVPTDSNLFINANGEFKQASVNDVVNSSTVVSTAVETAINTAVQDSIDSNFKQTSGSPILLTDSADGTLIDFKGKGRSTQRQWSGFDGELLSGAYGASDGKYATNSNYVCSKNPMPCKEGENIKLTYGTSAAVMSLFFYDENMAYLNYKDANNTNGCAFNAPTNASYFHFRINENNATMTPQTAKNITVTVNGSTSYPNPDYPQAIKSVADRGYFDGELLQGDYSLSTGAYQSKNGYVSAKNPIPCNSGDTVKIITAKPMYTWVYFYNEETFVSYIYSSTKLQEYEFTIPSGVTHIKFTIGEKTSDSTTTIDNVGKVCVTINGKYALIVKSVGKNLWEYGNQNLTQNLTINQKLKAGTYTMSALITSSGTDSNKSYVYMINEDTSNGVYGAILALDRNVRNGGTFTLANDVNRMTLYAETNVSTSVNDTATFADIQIEIGNTMTDYEPYKEEVKYIPLNEPLRSSLDGSVKDEVSLSENKVTRRIVRKRIVTVSKNNSTDVNNYCYYCALGNVGRSNRGMSNNLPNLSLYEVSINGTENIGQYISVEYGGVVYINVGKHLTENTVEGMTKWLSENPTYIQYELAEPITETIEPVDIVTYDNVTYLTASDNADMEIEYPTTKVAGIASIGYSKGIKAEYETEQLKKQLLEIQATIVNTL